MEVIEWIIHAEISKKTKITWLGKEALDFP